MKANKKSLKIENYIRLRGDKMKVEVFWKNVKGKDVLVFQNNPFFKGFNFWFDGDSKTLIIKR